MGYVMRQGRRIEVVTINPDPPPKRRKSFEPKWVKLPLHWVNALRRAKSPEKSVPRLRHGLQSFLRSIRRMDASFKNARALRLRFSQSLARRRQRLSQAIVRSTIQRLGNCTKPFA